MFLLIIISHLSLSNSFLSSSPSTPNVGKSYMSFSSTTSPSSEQVNSYLKSGHSCYRSFLPSQTITSLRLEIQNYTKNNKQQQVVKRKSEDEETSPFNQHFNLWKVIPAVKAITHSKLLSGYAKSLLNTRNVRLYQDSLFVKTAEHGNTPFHSDLRMTPFDTNKVSLATYSELFFIALSLGFTFCFVFSFWKWWGISFMFFGFGCSKHFGFNTGYNETLLFLFFSSGMSSIAPPCIDFCVAGLVFVQFLSTALFPL